MELDHSDIYENEEVYTEAFVAFASNVKRNLRVVKEERGIDRFLAAIQHSTLKPAKDGSSTQN